MPSAKRDLEHCRRSLNGVMRERDEYATEVTRLKRKVATVDRLNDNQADTIVTLRALLAAAREQVRALRPAQPKEPGERGAS